MKQPITKRKILINILAALGMALMFCFGSHMKQPVPWPVEAAIGFLCIIMALFIQREPDNSK
jgi:hypothetical protein